MNIWKRITVLVGVLALAMALVGCAGQAGSSSAASSSTSGNSSAASSSPSASASSASSTSSASSASSGQAADGTITMADYLRDKMASFDQFDAGIRSSDDFIQSLRLLKEFSFEGYLHDPAAIREYWDALSKVRIDVANATDKAHDPYVNFSFDSGRECISFGFKGSDYAWFGGGMAYPVQNPEEVKALQDSLLALIEKEQATRNENVPYENGAYLWDANGDGNYEHLSFKFSDNGDEAPSVMLMTLEGPISNVEAEGMIDAAYDIGSLESGTDEKGPYLIVECTRGDFYSHNYPTKVKVRLAGNKLVVEE